MQKHKFNSIHNNTADHYLTRMLWLSTQCYLKELKYNLTNIKTLHLQSETENFHSASELLLSNHTAHVSKSSVTP